MQCYFRRSRFFGIPAAGILLTAFLLLCDKSPKDSDDNLYNIRITEIHYNPSDYANYTSDSLEFIEIKNVGTSVIDIGTLEFTGGVSFTFPNEAKLDPGAFYLLASNKNAFELCYGFSPDGVYGGQLKNSSDILELSDRLTESVLIVQAYADTNGWPVEADGNGYSLVPVDKNGYTAVAGFEKWRRSVKVNGTPGGDDIKLPMNPALTYLRISEIHYHPADPDTFGGDSLEFIEMFNAGTSSIPLARVAFTGGIGYGFDSTALLESGKYLVLASNLDEFESRYGSKPFDVFSGQLSNSGESIIIEDVGAGEILIRIDYFDRAPWPSSADGGGFSLVPYSAHPSAIQNDPALWRRSYRQHGSPGRTDPGIVIVNEVISNPAGSLDDAIELYNPGDVPVDIGGWFLTDKKTEPVKFSISKGTVLNPDGYILFDAADFVSTTDVAKQFSLSAHGDEAYIMSDSSGCLGNGYCHGVRFDELEPGVSFGRSITASGAEVYGAQTAPTPGKVNAGLRIGPVIISEIHYASLDGKSDFIELTNLDLREIRLYDPANPENTWSIEGTTFVFPEGSTIKSGESIIIASDSISADAFRSRYKISDATVILPMKGGLSSSALLRLVKPGVPYIADSSVSIIPTVAPIVIDEVEYSDKSPWPKMKAGVETSLQRKKKAAPGDPANWDSITPAPGTIKE